VCIGFADLTGKPVAGVLPISHDHVDALPFRLS